MRSSPKPAVHGERLVYEKKLQQRNVRATECGGFVVCERILRNSKYEVCRRLHILGECSFVGERSPVDEACYVVAHLRRHDVLSGLDHIPGKVTAYDRTDDASRAVDVCWEELRQVYTPGLNAGISTHASSL